MARGKFVANKRAIGNILQHDPGIVAAVDEIADRAAAKAGPDATVEKRTTDRHQATVVVGAAEQAVDGVGTKAINEVRGFASRKDWRAAFAHKNANAHERAHATSGGWASLPAESSGE